MIVFFFFFGLWIWLPKVRALALSFINNGGYKLHPYPLAHLAKLLMMEVSIPSSLYMTTFSSSLSSQTCLCNFRYQMWSHFAMLVVWRLAQMNKEISCYQPSKPPFHVTRASFNATALGVSDGLRRNFKLCCRWEF